MAALVSAPWLAVVVPLLLAPVIALVGRVWRPSAPVLASLAPILVSLIAVGSVGPARPGSSVVAPWTGSIASTGGVEWFAIGDAAIRLGWTVDALAAIMLLVVGVVALCVVVFSVGYMHGDEGWARYFALLSLFTGSMSLLVIANGFATLFIGWELVGACSYLLIGYWYRKPAAAAAAVKAFLTTRIGDVGLLLGMGVLWMMLGTLDYEPVIASIPTMPASVLSIAVVLIAVGAIGKSAQFPLHAWLPDAMEGPTPVSALIHAATMVAAGVYLVARVWPLFEAAPAARDLLLFVGTVSAFGAALAGVAQRDIKKVLAYSTVSQLGFMFAALGVGAWVAAFFHLVAHAAFKALLFLGSGSVIHGSGTQDLHEMGGLRKAMPITFATWLVGVLALCGVPPFAGFFSKDAVLESVWAHAPAAGVFLFGASALTAFYCARATRLAFFGRPADGLHPHESGVSMLAPLVALAVPATVAGLSHGSFATLLGHEPEPMALGVSVAAVSLAAVGAAAGWLFASDRDADAARSARLRPVWGWLEAAYRWDRLVDAVIVRPTITLSRALWAWLDRLLIDGTVEGTGWLARLSGVALSRLQSGDAQAYAAVIAVGVAVMFVATALLGR